MILSLYLISVAAAVDVITIKGFNQSGCLGTPTVVASFVADGTRQNANETGGFRSFRALCVNGQPQIKSNDLAPEYAQYPAGVCRQSPPDLFVGTNQIVAQLTCSPSPKPVASRTDFITIKGFNQSGCLGTPTVVASFIADGIRQNATGDVRSIRALCVDGQPQIKPNDLAPEYAQYPAGVCRQSHPDLFQRTDEIVSQLTCSPSPKPVASTTDFVVIKGFNQSGCLGTPTVVASFIADGTRQNGTDDVRSIRALCVNGQPQIKPNDLAPEYSRYSAGVCGQSPPYLFVGTDEIVAQLTCSPSVAPSPETVAPSPKPGDTTQTSTAYSHASLATGAIFVFMLFE